MATPQPSDETLPDGTAFINATDSGTPSIVPPPSLNHVSSQPQRPSIASTVENAIRGSEDPQASLNNGLGNEQGRSPTVTDDNLLAANAFNHSQNELNSLTNTSDATNITRSTGHSTNDTTDEELRDFHCAIDLGGHSGIPNHYRHPGPSTSQFLEYDYTLHLQPKDVYENVDWNGNDDETPPREKYTPGILRDIEDLTARIYPYDDINSKSVEKIKIIELQHDEIANRKIYQNLVEEIGKDENMSRLLKMEFQVDQNFKPEVHLLGTLKPQRLRLKIKIPHMTTRSTNPNSTGKSLFEYSRTVFKDESFSQTEDGGIPISVHETCFMAINSEMILMVRSASNGEASPLPFFPLQHKCSVLHLLVHMISTVVQFSAQPVLDESWMQSTKVGNEIDRLITKVALENYHENSNNGRQIMNRLNCLISNVRSILHLLDSQMTALRQFQNMIKKGYHAHYTPSNGYHEIHLHLPFRLQGFRSLRIVLRELDILITERKEYTKEFQKLIHSLEQRQMTYTMFHATHEAAQKNFRSRESETKKITELMKQETKKITELMKQETKEITELMQQETKGVEEQRDIARKSFNTMSMFTVVTVFFLPPGFFCALWAILPGKDTRKPYSDVGAQGVNLYIDAVDEKPSLIIFCAVSIPITLTLTIITLYIVLLKKYKSGDHNWITKLFQKYVIGTNRYKSSNDPESGTPQNGQDPR